MLDAHQVCLVSKVFFNLLSIFKLSISDSEYFKLPINFTFLKFNFFRYLKDSLFEERLKLKLLNNFFEKNDNFFHLLKVFKVILPLISIKGISLFLS